jgi:hypothetical protein
MTQRAQIRTASSLDFSINTSALRDSDLDFTFTTRTEHSPTPNKQGVVDRRGQAA